MQEEWAVFVGLVLILLMIVIIIVLGDESSSIDCWKNINSIANLLSFGSMPRGIWAALRNFLQQKTVFHVQQHRFNARDAPLVCKALGAELATQNQLGEAYQKGANFCSTGWMVGQMAGYPIQPSFMQDVRQYVPSYAQSRCGKTGINGGYYGNGGMRFGVNCYGTIPDKDNMSAPALNATKLRYDDRGVPILNDGLSDQDKMNVIRDQFMRGDLTVAPFSQSILDTPAFQDVLLRDPDDQPNS
jgi:hypothetical protein